MTTDNDSDTGTTYVRTVFGTRGAAMGVHTVDFRTDNDPTATDPLAHANAGADSTVRVMYGTVDGTDYYLVVTTLDESNESTSTVVESMFAAEADGADAYAAALRTMCAAATGTAAEGWYRDR